MRGRIPPFLLCPAKPLQWDAAHGASRTGQGTWDRGGKTGKKKRTAKCLFGFYCRFMLIVLAVGLDLGGRRGGSRVSGQRARGTVTLTAILSS